MSNTGIPLQSAQNPPPDEDMLALLGLHPAQLEVAQRLHSGDLHPQQVLDAVTPKTPAPAPATPAAPLTPPSPVPLIASPRSAPGLPPIAQPSKTELDQNELARLQQTGSGLEQFQHRHPVLGTIARVGAGIGSAMFPSIAAAIPGTDIHHAMLENRQAGRVAGDIKEQQEEATTAQAQAHANLENAQAAVAGNPKQGLTPEETTIHDLMTGNNGSPRINPETGKPYTYLEAFQTTYQAKQDTKPDKTAKPTFEEENFAEWKKANPKGTRMQFEKELKAAERGPEKEPKQLAVAPGGKVIELKAGATVPEGTKTIAKYGEPTADEQRRSDLARNLNENLDQLEDIINRRPELFGPLAGRWTELKGKFGSDDPDVAALQTLEHQIGMAQISAHGMRSAHGIDSAAESIVNGFHSGPNALKNAIATARKSVGTFQTDAGDQAGNAPKVGTVENGYRFKGGDPSKQENWEQVKEQAK